MLLHHWKGAWPANYVSCHWMPRPCCNPCSVSQYLVEFRSAQQPFPSSLLECVPKRRQHWEKLIKLEMVLLLSRFSHVQLCVTPWTIACQSPLSMKFSRKEYWSGLPCPPPGDLPSPGIEPRSLALQADSLPSKPPGKPHMHTAAAAAAVKSLQSCPTLCDPIDSSPPGSSVPGILQARTQEWVAIFFSNAWKWKVKVKSLSRVRLFETPWTAAHQAPLSMGFSRQEYWSGVSLPSPYTHYYT